MLKLINLPVPKLGKYILFQGFQTIQGLFLDSAWGEIFHFPISLYSQRQYLSLLCLDMKYTFSQLNFRPEL